MGTELLTWAGSQERINYFFVSDKKSFTILDMPIKNSSCCILQLKMTNIDRHSSNSKKNPRMCAHQHVVRFLRIAGWVVFIERN